ncbi:sugar ABC transporter ATP-binding protein [Pseudaminobacter sp. 19-2017]|uniref:Sugar ABC transporter ATP-binding protein n=1 Tax=Pseudaminobacter soli (ex Zhang et al. 2022) TaxID=2831468 RepID=A0A942I3S1_9HYPH|nr:sugar ABC transporter ATP-binding protein [Pseudaminobacter soli]MBS3651722.1 sugar ABC transporter ATP-binding protein [Pseudaminobacter soli]
MPLLQTHALTRRFPGVLALDHVDFAAEAGEVHAVCGANGAGKSTLMNLLSGTITPTSGTISVNGETVSFVSPADARDAGIAIVYQEFSSIPELTVADNIFLGREFCGRFGAIDRRAASRAAADLLGRYGISLRPDALVGSLGVADRQLVEFARALATDARILILDEPTAVLSISEQAKLFGVIRTLRERGLLVLYISHRLEEVFEIADRVSVMRDGALVATREKSALTSSELVRLMTGRDVAANTAPALLVEGRRTALKLEGISENGVPLELREGEILGLAGLVGAGRTSIAHRIAGLRPRDGFSAALFGAALPDDPARVLAAGVVYMTEDRKRDGIFAPLAVTSNATAASLDRFALGSFLRLRRERAQAGEVLRGLRLVAASLDTPIGSLSGGNQQKVLFARALLARPKVLICDEPTRGADVGAKEEIYAVLRRLAAEGVAIILISSELNEVLALSHRIAVVRHGRITAVMDNAGLDEHALLVAATGAGSKNAAA